MKSDTLCIKKKKSLKKVYNNIMNSIKLKNSENSKTADTHRLLLNLTDKINLKRSDKYIALSNPSIYYTWMDIKKSYKKNINLKYQLQNGMKNLSYLIYHLLYQIFKIILNIP